MKCTKCNKEIKGGCYNPPSGVQCPECWEKVPAKKKKEMEKAVLFSYAAFAKNIIS